MNDKRLTIEELRELANTGRVELFDIAILNGAFFWAVEPSNGSYRVISLNNDGSEDYDLLVDGVQKNGTLDVPFQRTDFYEAIQNLETKRQSTGK